VCQNPSAPPLSYFDIASRSQHIHTGGGALTNNASIIPPTNASFSRIQIPYKSDAIIILETNL